MIAAASLASAPPSSGRLLPSPVTPVDAAADNDFTRGEDEDWDCYRCLTVPSYGARSCCYCCCCCCSSCSVYRATNMCSALHWSFFRFCLLFMCVTVCTVPDVLVFIDDWYHDRPHDQVGPWSEQSYYYSLVTFVMWKLQALIFCFIWLTNPTVWRKVVFFFVYLYKCGEMESVGLEREEIYVTGMTRTEMTDNDRLSIIFDKESSSTWKLTSRHGVGESGDGESSTSTASEAAGIEMRNRLSSAKANAKAETGAGSDSFRAREEVAKGVGAQAALRDEEFKQYITSAKRTVRMSKGILRNAEMMHAEDAAESYYMNN